MAKILSVSARKILDSRGDWTVKAEIFLENGLGAEASVPQGKSRGIHEACPVSAEKAVENINNELAPVLVGLNPEEQEAIDKKMMEIDGTSDKSKLGANTLLAVSLAVARVGALSKNLPLWEYLSGLAKFSPQFPRLLANVVNGGVHAGNNLDFQEYLLITDETNPKENIENIRRLYNSLKKNLEEKYGPGSVSLGDEGGFAPDIKDDIEPFRILKDLIAEDNLEKKLGLGLDAAASNIEKESGELLEIYEILLSDYPFKYLEDPFQEEEFDNFSLLNKKFGDKVLICGDDLTVTNPLRMKEAEEHKSVNSVIIKPNQIGTLTETLAAINFAKENGWKVIISHRSGETNDSFITDLAYGVGAYGLKLGAPSRGERIAKYNRLLEIIDEIE